MLALQIQTNVLDQLQGLILKNVLANQKGLFRTAEECFCGTKFKEMMFEILGHISETTDKFKEGFEMQEIVFNFALPPGSENFGQQFV
jgi:hypothetical protein